MGKGARVIWVYVWALPVIWCVLSFFGFQFHGDEYGAWAIGSLPAVILWVWFHGNVGDTLGFLLPVLLTGAFLMALTGFAMDGLRVPGPLFAVVYLVTAFLFATVLLSVEPARPIWTSEYPIPTYGIFALIMSLYIAIVLSTIGTIGLHIYKWTRRSKRGLSTAPADSGQV